MISYLQDYLDDVAFERLLIGNVAPVVPRDVGATSAAYDLKTGRMSVGISVNETLGMTLDEAVIKLGIVPLAVAATWKTIDVLMEYALEAQGRSPRQGRRWRIDEKVDNANHGRGDASPLSGDADVWKRLLGTYVGLEEIRHSLTHRRANREPNGDLVGVDRSGSPLRPMIESEQFAFCRAVSSALDAFERQAMSRRARNETLYHLDQLAAWHGLTKVGAYERTYPVPRVEVTVEPPYELKLSIERGKLLGKFGNARELDLIVKFSDQPRQLLFELEGAPADDLTLDPLSPPDEAWCQVLA